MRCRYIYAAKIAAVVRTLDRCRRETCGPHFPPKDGAAPVTSAITYIYLSGPATMHLDITNGQPMKKMIY
jgi:hypothetical protein